MNPLRNFRHLLISALLGGACLASQAQDKPDYQLATGDSVHIQVFQNPDLTMDGRVSETGSISYPLIGAVDIGGLSTMAAEKKIADALQKGGFLQNPQVTVTLVQVRGNQISVLGQVNRPGRFALESINTRLSDMLANAGGTTPLGDDTVIVSGVRNGKPFRQTVDVPALFLQDKSSNDLVVQGGDVIYVNKAPVFYIYGEAQRPGSYRIERGMTVMQALAQGGGPSARGSEKRLRLHRKAADGSIQLIEPQLTDVVQADDVLYVKESIF